MRAKEREITVVVGPNGSGKSTLLKSIFGLTTIYSGTIALDGEELSGLPAHRIARMGLAYLPQTDNVFANLSVADNLTMAGYTVADSDLQPRLEEVLEMFPILKEYVQRRAGTLSGGERQMLAMAMALLRKPKVMMFDEPTGNLSPKLAFEVLEKIIELKTRFAMVVILVEQSARRALEVGNQAYLLVSGRLVFEGKSSELLAQPELNKLYLGIRTD